jgi:hypothetical protein
MKILLAVDDSQYSRYAAAQTAKLALNAWADVTILGSCGPSGGKGAGQGRGCPGEDVPLLESLHQYQAMFLEEGTSENNPYRARQESREWVPTGKGTWEELEVMRGARKNLRLILRQGGVSQVLAEDAAADYDLIVLGYGPKGESLPETMRGGLQKIIENARASVLLVKQDQPIRNLLVCLDTSEVPQRSMEIINLIAYIHQASLQILGVMREGWLEIEVDKAVYNLHRYFASNQSEVITSFTEHSELLPFVSKKARSDLLVLWRGKHSIVRKLFPQKWLNDLVGKSQTSVLVLR